MGTICIPYFFSQASIFCQHFYTGIQQGEIEIFGELPSKTQ
jgi:hypothetical protein